MQIVLGALAAKDAVDAVSKIDASRLNGFRIMKTEYWIDYGNKTTAEGPITVGFAVHHSEGEVEEAIEADPQNSADMVLNATAKRPVWPLETIPQSGTGSPSDLVPMRSFNPRWSCIEGKNAFWWAYNRDDAALTTGGVVNIFAKHYGVWLRD